MPDKPASPFQGLDKALLRSTRGPAAPPPNQAAGSGATEIAAPTNESTDRRTGARTHAPTEASKRADKSAATDEDIIKSIYRKLQMKQHLTGYTFRFRASDLEALDEIYSDLNRQYPRLSKNDLPRIALDWLLADYKEHGDESILAQVLARM